MNDYILLMYDDAPDGRRSADDAWPAYFEKLRAAAAFQGGSSIDGGLCVRKSGPVPEISHRLNGYIRISAIDLEAARSLLGGNPVFEAGGTVEIRELPKDE